MWIGVCVFLAGGLGALCRSVLDTRLSAWWATKVSAGWASFPAGTFVINVSGAFALGLITGFATAHTSGAVHDLATVVGVGFFGAYTTFSTEEWHTLGLLRRGGSLEAWNVLGSLTASLALGGLGLWLGQLR